MFPTYCWAWAPRWGMFCCSLSFVNAYQLWAASQKGWESLSTSPFKVYDTIWYKTIRALFLLTLSLQVHNLLLWKPCFLGSSIPSGSHGLSTSSSVEFPESWGERLDGDVPLWWRVSRPLICVHCLAVGLCICAYLLQEEASLMVAEQSTDLSVAEYH